MRYALTSSSLVSAVAARLGWSEGQVGTGAVGMAAATLLIVLGLPPVLNQELPTPVAAPALGVADPVDPAPSPTETVPTWSSPVPGLDLPEMSSPIPPPLTTTPSVTSSPPPAAPDSPATEAPCPSDAQAEDVRGVLEALDSAGGGTVPDRSVVAIIRLATGCSEADPAFLLLASLIEIGESLPDPGLDPALPGLPFVELPPAVIDLVQPLRPALDPLCEAVGMAAVVLSQVGPYYPSPTSAAFTASMVHALSTCGQIQQGT